MNHLIVFVKNPIPGAVKTRFQTRYTPEHAADIYTAFVHDVLDTAGAIPLDKRIIAYAPPGARDAIKTRFRNDHWDYVPQPQTDLGTRMHTALLQQLESGATRAVLIDTDIPSLPADHIAQAFDILNEKDVVLGPSTDGGYFLVGISKPCPKIFEGITWSTPSVLSQTIARIETHRYSLGLTPPWFDVDTPEELDLLLAHARAQTLATGTPLLKHTQACLSALT